MTQTLPPQSAAPTTTDSHVAPTASAPTASGQARPDLPLARRPRRAPVRREPTPRAAARRLRRTAPRTTARTWTRRGLPGPATATARATAPEVVLALVVVGLLFVPVLVWTQAAPGAFVGLGAAVLVVAYLAWARRVVVGPDFVAVRQVGRYHVASADHVRHLELRAMQGGALCLHTDDGRRMVLRRVELEQDGVSEAMRTLADCGSSTRDRRVCAALGLADVSERFLDRYLPAAT